MTRLFALAVLSLMLSGPATASGTQLQRLVQQELDSLGFKEVDATTLSTAQLAAIHQVANEKRREGGRRGVIRSILGGTYSLRSLFR